MGSQTVRRLTLRGVKLFEHKIRISPRKRIFQLNHLACLSGAQVSWIPLERNAKKSRKNATLSHSPHVFGKSKLEFFL